MIKYISFIESFCTDPYRNIAEEKYITSHVGPSECVLFLWENHRTVVIGKNQNVWAECEIGKMKSDSVRLARRLSGGGAVYHDAGNLNYSFCAQQDDYDVERQMNVILRALLANGIPAEKSGRNDISVQGRKCSGNAFYQKDRRCCHHGTLMIDVDKEALGKYLNVPPDKLKSKGIASVRSRVINLSEINPAITSGTLRRDLIRAFTEEYGLPARQWETGPGFETEVSADAAFLSSEEWLYDRPIPFSNTLRSRFPWGGIELQLNVDRGRIAGIRCYTDSMCENLPALLEAALTGLRYDPAGMSEAVLEIPEYGYFTDSVKQNLCELLQHL